MRDIRIHGRGGQGGLTAARILADAALKEGKPAQAFPEFGPERRGAPVRSYLRIDDQPIQLRTSVESPDVVIVMDVSLLTRPETLAGIKPGGLLIINAPSRPVVLTKVPLHVAWVDAMGIANRLLGRPIPSTAMLGAWCRADGTLSREVVETSVRDWFQNKNAEGNVMAVCEAWESMQIAEQPPSRKATQKERTRVVYAYLDEYPKVAIATPIQGASGRTGSWRVSDPKVDQERCIRCGRCATFCPEGVSTMEEVGPQIDLTYCKGCGICVVECPVDAIDFEEEI